MQTETLSAEDVIAAIPEEAWPFIELLFNITIVLTIVWLAYTVFVMMRRDASNLTPINAASPNKHADPDFLSVDKKARKEAFKQGEAFDKQLDQRDRDETKAAKVAARRKESMWQRVTRLISFFMALFTMATMISGTLFQVSIMGRYWEQYSAGDRLMHVITEYPLGVAITLFVIGYNIVNFVIGYRKKEA